MPRVWSPFQLSQGASDFLLNNTQSVESATDLNGSEDFILVVPPDQQLIRCRATGMGADHALEQLVTLYTNVVDGLEQQTQLRTERELLNLEPEPVDPLTAAVLLQLLANTPELAQSLECLDARLQSNELSRQRLINSCKSRLSLIEAWWAPHNDEAGQMEVVLMQQQQQLQRLTQQLQSTANS